jgi:membrane protease YdiL (CAAX protease family)
VALLFALVGLVVLPTLYFDLTVTPRDRLAAQAEWVKLNQTHTELAVSTWSGFADILRRNPGVLAFAILLAQAVLLTLVLGLAWLVSPKARSWMALTRVAARPAPAVRIMDLALVILLLKVVLPVWFLALIVLAGGSGWGLEARLLAGLLLQSFVYALGIALVVGLARRRGGPAGAAGIWPFWETAGVSPPRDPAGDVGLGLVALFVCFWLLLMANNVNLELVRGWHRPPDTNPLLVLLKQEIQGPARFGVYALMFVLAVVVAAVGEEILFRGLLYNVLRRYLDRWTAAVLAALVFSFAHGVALNLWSLFLLALVLTWLYERTGRLLAPVVLHAANNGIALVLVLMGVPQP